MLKLLALVFCLLSFATCKDSKSTLDGLDVAALMNPPANGQTAAERNAETGQTRRTAITNAVEKVSDAVCGINVIQLREARRSPFSDEPFFRFFYGDRPGVQRVKSLGSGFLISADGYILTNEHVVHKAAEILVVLSDGTQKSADVVGLDYISDIGLIKIDGDGLPYTKFGDSDDVIIGEWVIALGNPFGLFEINASPTVTVGVVSALDRDFGRQKNDRVYQDMIQTDAAINQGNSGGPLVNSLGEVIGMNTFIYTGGGYNTGSIGLGFALPSNTIKRVLRDLKEYGEVNRRWTSGLTVEALSPLVASYFRLQSTHGVIVTKVEKGSPGARAGLTVGDVIVEANDIPIRNENDIWRIINDSDLRGGDTLEFKVFRDRKEYLVTLRLEGLAN